MYKGAGTWNYVLLCQTLGYQFNNEQLLVQALTRQSSIQEGLQEIANGDHQRLEFLGDRVIGLVIAKLLFEEYPEWNEEGLTKGTSNLVNNKGPLIKVANVLGLQKYLITGKGERYLVDSNHAKILSDHVEAVFGAIFLDCKEDFTVIRRLVLKHWRAAGLINIKDAHISSRTKKVQHIDKQISAELAVIIKKYLPGYGLSRHTNPLEEALMRLVENPIGIEQEKDLEILLQAGANPNSTKELLEEYCDGDDLCYGNGHLHSALQFVVIAERPSLVAMNLLLDAGADPNWNETMLKNTISPAVRLGLSSSRDIKKFIPTIAQTKLTALHLIATRNCCENRDEKLAYEVVKLLLARNADPLRIDSNGNTPYATRAIHQKGPPDEKENVQITQLLFQATHNTVIDPEPDPEPAERGVLGTIYDILEGMSM